MPQRSRRRKRPVATLPQQERERLLSYLPTESALPAREEAPESRPLGQVQARTGAPVGTAASAEPKPLIRDYSYLPADLRRIALLTAAIVVLLVVLAIVLR